MFREGEFSIGYGRCDNDWESATISTYLLADLRNAIMSRPNDWAFALLQKTGYIGCAEGFGDTKISFSECADFYGVTSAYLRGVVNRNRFRDCYPDEFCEVNAGGDVKVEYLGCSGKTVRAKGKRVLMTPRFALMVAMYMSPAERVSGSNMIRNIMLALKRSTYRFPLASFPEESAAKEKPVVEPSPVPEVPAKKAEEQIAVAQTVMISPEFFGKMVMSAAISLVEGGGFVKATAR